MSNPFIIYSIDEQDVAHIRFNRPEKHNAINEAMIDGIQEFCQSLTNKTRMLIISAEGKNFCAGADLQWMRTQFIASQEQQIQQSTKLATMLRTIEQLPFLVVSIVQGAVYGGGLGILAVCDRIIASNDCQFCFSETLLGLIPATIGPFVYAKAGNKLGGYFINAQHFDSITAQRLGLVTEIVNTDELTTAMNKEIKQILSCDLVAVAKAKNLLKTFKGETTTDDFQMITTQALADCWQQPNTRKRIKSFLNR